MKFISVFEKTWGVLILCFSTFMTLWVQSNLYGESAVISHPSALLLQEYIGFVVLFLAPVTLFLQMADPTVKGLLAHANWAIYTMAIPLVFVLVPFVCWVFFKTNGPGVQESLILAQRMLDVVSILLVQYVIIWLMIGFMVAKVIKRIGL